MAKKTKELSSLTNVELVAGKRRESFKMDHAARILSMPKNGGWKLPDDSKLEFNGKDGFNQRTIKG